MPFFPHHRLGCQHHVRASPLVRFSTGAKPRTTPLRLLSAMTIGDPPQEVLHWEEVQFGHTYGKVTQVLTSLLLDPPQEASTLTHDCLQDLFFPSVTFLRTTQIFSHTKAGQFRVHSLSTSLQLPSLSPQSQRLSPTDASQWAPRCFCYLIRPPLSRVLEGRLHPLRIRWPSGIDCAFSLPTSSCNHLQIPSRHCWQGPGHSRWWQ